MKLEQPKPDSKKFGDLIRECEKGEIKIPKFQREFVWSRSKTANLLDSILKGYPIGTFILWQTNEKMSDVKNIGNLQLPDTPEGREVQYVLDGQQRITSLFAAYLGAEIQKSGQSKPTKYSEIFVNIFEDPERTDHQIISDEPVAKKYVPLHDVLQFDYTKSKELEEKSFSESEINLINAYSTAFKTYDFSTVVLKKKDIDSAIEVFTRINTGGETLTLFEIMCAKTYDEQQNFDMQAKWKGFIDELDDIQYETISSSIVLSLLSLVLSRTKECKRKTILELDKEDVIQKWGEVIAALKYSIDYFRTTLRIPVSQLLPYDSLLVPFAYFFFHQKHSDPNSDQRKYLEEFFWRMSLSYRYSSTTESRLAQDIKRIDFILEDKRPDYSDIYVHLDSGEALIETNFSAGNSYCKAILCLLAYQQPKDFRDNGAVLLDNSWLQRANSKNFHHFFPKKYLERNGIGNENSLMNITFVSEKLNKRAIRAQPPSKYIGKFEAENNKIGSALQSHLIKIDNFGIQSNDYGVFLKARSQWVYQELTKRIELRHEESMSEKLEELIKKGESNRVEFKSTLQYDLRSRNSNPKLGYSVAKTIAAFLNSDGGDLFIGIDDDGNVIGLSNDFSILKKSNFDGFQLRLREIIKKYIGDDFSTHIKVDFPTREGLEICHIRVEKSSKPVFLSYEGNEHFYVRSGNSSQPLSRKKQSSYEKEHWG